jgi:phenylacetate-CoA ligase
MALPLLLPIGPLATVGALLRSMLRLEKEQWLAADELAAIRRARLGEMMAKASEAPYYKAALQQAGIQDPEWMELSDLQKLPFVDRRVIARYGLDAFLTVDRSDLFGVRTSGSTGDPGYFLRSKLEEADYSSRWWRVYAAFGCSMRDAQINVGIPHKPDRAGPINLMRKLGVLPRVERSTSDVPPDQVLEKVRLANAPILTGYAGAIEALAEHVLATGAEVPQPRAVFCTAMEVTDRCLQLAERAFKAPAVDVYVTNEFGVVAWSCPVRRDLLHTNDDGFIIEVVGPDGAPVPPGTLGELVVTSLGLTSMPLIRYRMGDMAARVQEPCGCGRGLGLITRVHGRTAHAIRRPNGGLITTPLVSSFFGRADAHEWVRGYQVREEPGRLRFLLALRRPPSKVQRDAFTQIVESTLGSDYQVSIEYVDHIPMAPNGKRQYLVPWAARAAQPESSAA